MISEATKIIRESRDWLVGWHPSSESFAIYGHGALIASGFSEIDDAASELPRIALARAIAALDPKTESSLTATLLGFQELYDSGLWDDSRLASAVMHLDIDSEGEAGEIARLREDIAELMADNMSLERERDGLRSDYAQEIARREDVKNFVGDMTRSLNEMTDAYVKLESRLEDLQEVLRDVAIPSLAYCEVRYGHDEQARLNCEAALQQKV
jgi:hypothetical protein